MSELGRRVLTAAFGGSVFLAAVFWQPWSMAAAFGVIAFFSLYEYYQIFGGQQDTNFIGRSTRILIAFSFFLLPTLFALEAIEAKWLGLLLPLVVLLFIKELWRNKADPLSSVGIDLLGAIYICLPLSLLVMLGVGKFGPQPGLGFHPFLVCGILLLIWANDIGAYFSGRAFGKTPLFKRVSPKKSWEGFAGGLLTTMAVAVLWSTYLPRLQEMYPAVSYNAYWQTGGDLSIWLAMGAICAVFGPLGDLVESLLKRSKGIKDSGSILPGHGGFLDRFDALFMVIPLVYALLLALV